MLHSFAGLVALAFIIGFSIFLSFPIIFSGRMSRRSIVGLTSAAAGILAFLMADIFGDVSSAIYPAGSYVANAGLAAIFAICAGGSFLILYTLQNRSKTIIESSPMGVSIIVAIAIGFQNLTEGMVFGATWAVGLTGLLAVIFVGFVLQNFTEGFPIVSPFLGSSKPSASVVASLFLLGAFPTIIGSLVGYFYSNTYLNVAFDALAIGSILYIIMPMFQTIFQNLNEKPLKDVAYLGLIGGFLVGFLVNII